MGRLVFIFVHGLSGWGSYDEAYRRMPYWGMRGGDLMTYLHEKGFECYAASVAPAGSAWDRACELYAQMAGKQVDYGKKHSETYGHSQMGRDFSLCPLMPAWDQDTRLVLLGHSFGGITARLFADLMAYGDEQERNAGSTSPLFEGGKSCVHALVTLAAPSNGTTAYDMFQDPDFDPSAVRAPWWSRYTIRLMSRGRMRRPADMHPEDSAAFDMHVDRAMELNARIRTREDVYYFSIPCSATVHRNDGTWKPETRIMEPLYVYRAAQMGAYSGRTRGGVTIGEEWRENDGLVNTLSAKAPMGAPSRPLDREHIQKGVWNVFPVYHGDHMSLQGGLMHRRDVRELYTDLLDMIRGLE